MADLWHSNAMRKSGLLSPLILLVCWTGLMLAGTYVLVETTVRQHLALKFATTLGRIVRSEMGQGNMSRRGLEIEYTYTVDGVKYHGYRYRYDDHNVTLEWQSTIVVHPRWSSQQVFYNPKNPADSLLKPGVDGIDFLLLLFVLPLNVLTVILWRVMLVRLRENFPVRPAGGVRILKQRGETRIPLGDASAFGAALYVMGAAAFVAAFPVVITGGFDPSMFLMQAAWGGVLGLGGAAFVWRLVRNWSGIYDLRINPNSQTVTLPQTAGRQQPLSLARREISSVSLQRRASKGPSGTHFSFLPALNHNGPEAQSRPMKLITWGWTEAKARAFSQWLSQELGVEFKGIEEEENGSMFLKS
jgi:hypothetical protein